ncbi:MAG: hypothetical protein UX60_C0018G0006 [Berkelbacteria bacterium GW2011_GWA2_46_7]|uniref:Uncharacterized protein n=1 Tax=Berkelbacteria bacterium GW2011_GWA2_46_7 TaxID=1618335 RepID=A0A0G1QFI2_9BACT|nr:MAG: hypothetical protein UX60_C0018G0006 [Berkelbacteria bacterium GW2011_GWA2_46_7]
METKKLNKKVLWGIGIASTTLVGALWLLNRHKDKSADERDIELDRRDEARMTLLDERLAEINLKIEFEEDERVVETLKELKSQVSQEKQRVSSWRELPRQLRLAMEVCEETAAKCEHELELREQQSPDDNPNSG